MSERMGHLLIVDDDAVLLNAIEQWLTLCGFQTACATSVEGALALMESEPVEAILTDLRMPGRGGLDLLHAVQQRWPEVPVVLLTAHGDVPQAVEALKGGAFDFLVKPHDPARLAACLRNACRQCQMQRALRGLERERAGPDPVEERLVGRSEAMRRLQGHVRALASAPLDVLLFGETGSGKEVVARTLHECGPRAEKPFVAINCAAIPSEMIESELFGHESGAFTGAMRPRIGKFEFADGGTLFLDEIESMPMGAQAKLLRVLQERALERVGSNRRIPIDIRVVSASKADLRLLAQQGLFRDDLYYRIAGFELPVPPLRQRDHDALLLFHHFARVSADRAGTDLKPLSSLDALALLEHDWPGNVRELRLVAERFGLGLGLEINRMRFENSAADGRATLDTLLNAYERRIIMATLNETGGSISQAIDLLGVPRRTLNDKMRRLGILRPA